MPAPEELPDSVMLQSFTGLRNTVSRERLGPTDLEIAVNIDLDDVGQPHRRRGYVKVADGSYHSLFDGARHVYGVKNGRLGIIMPDYDFIEILEDAGRDTLAYCEVGDTIYLSSRSISGRIMPDDTFAEWGETGGAGEWISPVVNPTATLQPVRGRLLSAPPLATSLAHLGARIYLANGSLLWATEPFLYNYIDRTRNFFQYEGPILGIAAVTNGLYVGTAGGVWFQSGDTLDKMRRVRVSSDALIPGSMVRAPKDMVGKKTPTRSEMAIAMMTTGGVCVGYDGGVFEEVTDEKVWLPSGETVAAFVREQDGVRQYVATAHNGGSPASNARIGDYVDAEIRRFQGAP